MAKAERVLGDKEVGRENRCLGNYETLKGKLYKRKIHVGKDDREMGRGRKILWKDFPGHFATRSVPKSDRRHRKSSSSGRGNGKNPEWMPEALHWSKLKGSKFQLRQESRLQTLCDSSHKHSPHGPAL